MFTRDSRRLRSALAAVATALGIFLAVHGAQLGLSRWAEAQGTYPYRAEDWLRYLLPSFFAGNGAPRLFLSGPSSVRENLLHYRFADAFPGTDVFLGATSLATLDSTLLALEYTGRVYGEAALPRTLVLGIDPRFVGNLPRDRSPLADAIDDYSPYFRVVRTAEGSRLEPKPWWKGWLARARFLGKQQARYKAALCALALRVFPSDVPYEEFVPDFPAMRSLVQLVRFQPQGLRGTIDLVLTIGWRAAIGRWLFLYTRPYKYHYLAPMRREVIEGWMNDRLDSFWPTVHEWDPQADAPLIRAQFRRLRELASRHDIRIYVVNLPENPLSLRRYDPDHYERYLTLVRESLDGVPMLDLRSALVEDDFYDVVHASLPAALRMTDEVIGFVRRNGGASPS